MPPEEGVAPVGLGFDETPVVVIGEACGVTDLICPTGVTSCTPLGDVLVEFLTGRPAPIIIGLLTVDPVGNWVTV